MKRAQHNFIEFNSFDSMTSNKFVINNLVNTYQDIFSDPLIWDEQYTEEDVLNNLENELSGEAIIRLCMSGNEIIGFCWAQLLDVKKVESSIKSIKFFQEIGCPDIQNTLYSIIGDEPVIYLHDLGVESQYRGQVDLQKLISPVLRSLALRTRTNRVFFWSIESTRVFKLAQRAGFKLAKTENNMQFFIGDL